MYAPFSAPNGGADDQVGRDAALVERAEHACLDRSQAGPAGKDEGRLSQIAPYPFFVSLCPAYLRGPRGSPPISDPIAGGSHGPEAHAIGSVAAVSVFVTRTETLFTPYFDAGVAGPVGDELVRVSLISSIRRPAASIASR